MPSAIGGVPRMRCSRRCAAVSDLAIGLGDVDGVRSIQRRRNCDDAAVEVSLASAERGTVWIARDVGEAVGIVVSHDSETERYVGDLFVEPSYRGTGVGGELLSAAFLDAGDRTRAMMVDPSDRASVALALRQRMMLREPIARLAGAIPREEELAKMAAGNYRFEVGAVDSVAHGFGLRGLDAQTRGTTRDADHEQFARSATGHAFFLRGEFVAYVYVWPDGRIGPLGCASQAYLVQIFAYALLSLTRTYGASWCSAFVPGSNLRIARAALRAGLRIEAVSLLCADAFQGDLSTYVGFQALLL
jgi:GNAT superfamily N-acetyltransferase